MMQAPWTDTGRLQQDVSSLQSDMFRKADKHEVSSISGDVARLEREIGEVRTAYDGLRNELSELQENYRAILNVLEQMTIVI